MGKKYSKKTVGFVTQFYEENDDGLFVCISQEFIAGDQVDYETEDGTPIEIDTKKEEYQPFHMAKPFII